MCGISACICLDRKPSEALTNGNGRGTSKAPENTSLKSRLAESLQTISHRGPDAHDVWISSDNRVGLGHCRLSINDLSEDGEQPLHDPEGQIHAVVIGEIYDDKDQLRKDLTRDIGYQFQGHSDSELVIALYKKYGSPDFFQYLRGEFSFVLYDERNGQVIAARDRFGIKPLYWTIVENERGRELLFAAEIKAFIAMGWQAEWNVQSMLDGTMFSSERTLFQRVYKVLPAYYMTVTADGTVSHNEYWDLTFPNKHHVETRTPEEMIEQVREKMIESIRIRLRADVPVGIYLSGGLDSSTVAGIIKHLVRQGTPMGNIKDKIACFCISFDKDSGFDESDIAGRTADFLGVDMFVKEMNEGQMAQHFEDSVWHNENPTFDLNTIGKFALSQLPRKRGFKVILTGEGSDEIFAGYPWYPTDYLQEPDYSSPDQMLDEETRKKLLNRAEQDLQTLRDAQFGVETSKLDSETAKTINNSSATSDILLAMSLSPSMFNKDFNPTDITVTDRVKARIQSWSPEAKERALQWHPLHTGLYSWVKSQLANWILVMLGDRTEMAHSIEARPPFLDHHLAELVAGMPPSVKLRYGAGGSHVEDTPFWRSNQASGQFWEKWILREAAKPFITEELYYRRKHPYAAPLRWPKDGPLHQTMKRLITEKNIEALGFLEWRHCERMLDLAFRENAESPPMRTCFVIAGMVVLSKRFNIPKAAGGIHVPQAQPRLDVEDSVPRKHFPHH